MSHKHFCLNCDRVIAEGDFDCEIDEDHDFELCLECQHAESLADKPVCPRCQQPHSYDEATIRNGDTFCSITNERIVWGMTLGTKRCHWHLPL